MLKSLFVLLLIPFVAEALITNSAPSCDAGICKIVKTIPHFIPNGTSEVSLHLWYREWQRYAILRRQKPLALILAGAIVQPEEYSVIATILAKRGYLVAVPEYSARPLRRFLPKVIVDAIDAAIAAGYDCSRNGNIVTAQVVTSVSDFLASNSVKVNQKDTLLIGHSHGGVIATAVAFGVCNSQRTPFEQEYFCEGFKQLPPRLRVTTVAMYEGASLAPFTIPKSIVAIHAYSPFYAQSLGLSGKPKAQEVRDSVVGGRKRFLDVSFSNGTNHFLPVNFEEATNHSRTICKDDRPPPEDKFSTTDVVQSRVIQTCANVADIVYFSFTRGLWMVRRMIVVILRLPMIDNAYFL